MSHTSTYDMIITAADKFIAVAQECGLSVKMVEIGHLYGSNIIPNAVCEVKLKGWVIQLFWTKMAASTMTTLLLITILLRGWVSWSSYTIKV